MQQALVGEEVLVVVVVEGVGRHQVKRRQGVVADSRRWTPTASRFGEAGVDVCFAVDPSSESDTTSLPNGVCT